MAENRGAILDGLIEAGVYLVAIGGVLAFGAVEEWSLALMKFLCFLIFTLWVFRKQWLPERTWRGPGDIPGGRVGRILGVEYRKTGLGLPILLFLLLVGFQLLPLPRAAIARMSPTASRLYETGLPGYDGTPVEDAAGFARWLLDRSPERPGAGQDAAAVFAGVEFRPIPDAGRARTLSLNPYLTRERLFRLLAYLALFVVVVNHFAGGARTRRAVLILVGSGFAVSLFGIVQKLSWNGRIYWFRRVEVGWAFGPYVNHNHFAGFLELIIPLAAGSLVALLARGRGSPRSGTGLLSRDDPRGPRQVLPKVFLALFGIGILLTALILSLSRAGILATVAGLALFLTYTLRKRGGAGRLLLGLLFVGVLLGGLIVWIGPEEAVDRLQTFSDLENEPALTSRLFAWKDSLALVRDYPVLGTGLGTFVFAFQRYYSPGFVRVWDRLHNDYLEVLCDTGVLGFSVFLAGFLIFLKKYLVRPYSRGVGEPGLGPLLAGCSAGMLGLLLHSFVDFNLQIGANGLLFILVAGLLVGNVAAAGEGLAAPPARPGGAGRGLAVAVLVPGLILSSAFTWKKVRADHWHRAADRAYWEKRYPAAHAAYLRALPLKPYDSNLWLHTAELYLAVLEDGEPIPDRPDLRDYALASEALQCARRSLDLNPAQSWAWSVLGQMFRQVKFLNQRERVFDLADLAGDAGDPFEPEDNLTLAALALARELEPNSYFYQGLLGEAYWNAGQDGQAISHFREAVRMAPTTELHMFLQRNRSDPRVAAAILEGFEAALETTDVFPDDEVHRQIASFRESIGDLRGAIGSLERAREARRAGNGPELYHIGRLLRELGESERSNQALLEYLEVDPGNGNARHMVGLNFGLLGDHARAVRFLQEAVFLEPGRIRYHVALAREHERGGDPGAAEAEYLMALRLDPDGSGVYPALVRIYVEGRNFQKALGLLEDWGKRDPDNTVQKHLLAEVRNRLLP